MNEYAGSAAIGARARGSAPVAKDGFSARYDLDRQKGIVWRREHRLVGQSDFGRIMMQGAVLADCTMIFGCGMDITQAVPDGPQAVPDRPQAMPDGPQAVPDGALVEDDPDSDPPCLRMLCAG